MSFRTFVLLCSFLGFVELFLEGVLVQNLPQTETRNRSNLTAIFPRGKAWILLFLLRVTTKRASSSGDAKSQVRRSKTPSFEEIPAGVPLPRSSESPSSRKGSPKRAGAKLAKKSRGSQSQEPSETAVSTPCDNSNEKEVCFKEPGDDKENCSSQCLGFVTSRRNQV